MSLTAPRTLGALRFGHRFGPHTGFPIAPQVGVDLVSASPEVVVLLPCQADLRAPPGLDDDTAALRVLDPRLLRPPAGLEKRRLARTTVTVGVETRCFPAEILQSSIRFGIGEALAVQILWTGCGLIRMRVARIRTITNCLC